MKMKFATMMLYPMSFAVSLAMALGSSPALADQGSATAAPIAQPMASASSADHPVGAATRAYLEMQSSNRAAAPVRPGGGEEASLVYHRYLDSFKHPIPAFFGSSTGKGSGAPSGAAN